ncbi:hypothetical protein [Microbacterium aurantiacum]|uniref:hypothetical protein n=1 Tax=Microbacterium aurantiacum TaxID=162393 RepID=UPI000C808400|nr:hypothetical protein [Microbacterium aurantiacum]
MTLRSDLIDALEVAITDEAYDGGFGPQSEQQYSQMVRKIAEVAAEVFEKAHAPAGDEREAMIVRLSDELEYRVRTAVALSKGGRGIGGQVTDGRAAVRHIAAGLCRFEASEPRRVEEAALGAPLVPWQKDYLERMGTHDV